MVRNGAIVGDTLMTLFTFPGSLKNPGYLLNCFGHLVIRSFPVPFNQSDRFPKKKIFIGLDRL